ncbi:glycine receptor subunit alpha-2-like [Asterias amurensis]|uniref:glycine receptor subunit alpha-2-like n=1 Tax=Asterias amurensis TaxID=7602 RepID=UPI003AB1C2A5
MYGLFQTTKVLLCCLLVMWHGVEGMNTSAILDNILDGYDVRLRPDNSGAPVNVRIGIYVESMESVRESTMDFSVTMYLRMFWQDTRLSFHANEGIVFKGDAIDNLWVPDVFFLFEKKASVHSVTQPNRLLRVQSDGSITYSARVSATLACNMQLQQFPMDSQKCTIIMSSYAYSTADVILFLDEQSVEIEKGLTISKFSLTNWTYENVDLAYLLGNYSSPRCHFFFQRQMESYLLTVYIPTVLLVSIAWLSFWIDAKAAPARVALGITTVLTVTTMTAGIQETLPVVTYAKAIDVWLAVCLLFVFFSLLEYGMANYLLVKQTSQVKDYNDVELQTKEQMETEDLRKSSRSVDTKPQKRCGRHTWTAHRLDCYARWAYPVTFVIFNIFYWIYYNH